jgi:hypothetical protein
MLLLQHFFQKLSEIKVRKMDLFPSSGEIEDNLLSANLSNWTIHAQVKFILRLTASRPVSPDIRPPSGTCDQFFFYSTEIIWIELWVSYY